jgi:hypothetical protein
VAVSFVGKLLNPEMGIKGLKLMWIKKKFKSSSNIIKLLPFSG